MADWRSKIAQTGDRRNQLTGNNAKTGLFQAFIDTSTGESQSGKFVYAGGERTIPIPMPFQSSSSWIRAIPEGSTPVLAGYRSDLTGETVCLNYMLESPKDILAAYETQLNLYRPLLPGEIEINSRGGAQAHYAARPVLEQRAGSIRLWLNQDRVEAGIKAPTHVRYLHDQKSNSVGDEERFGVVKRPYNFLFDPLLLTPRNALSALLALSSTSYNFYDYPIPGATTPLGVADIFSPRGIAAAAAAATPALIAVGKFKQRPFAKEYLRVISNPLFPLSLNSKLIDIREGQVFDDMGMQTISSTGAFLRASYKYFTPALDATTIEIDEVGNMSHQFSIGAYQGWNITIPTGPYKLFALQDIGMISAAGNISTNSTLSTGITALTDLNLMAVTGFTDFSSLGVSVTSPTASFSHTMSMDGSWTSLGGNLKTTAALNIDFLAGVNFTAKATTGKMTLFAPFIDIGAAPTEAMILGTRTAIWLTQLITALQAAAPIGNVGAPVPFSSDPALATTLATLSAQIEALKSVTIKVGP